TAYPLTGLVPGRDFDPSEIADIRYAVPGDRAANGQELRFEKCIEVGHVFKLGTKYSQSMNATVLDASGVAQPLVMGCYGIGANRIMAAAIESSHDDGGICWPMSIAPFQVEIVALDVRDEAVMSQARRLHDELEGQGYEVLLDDRDARPGVKFKDADLIGVPLRVTVGKRGLAENIVEFKKRTESDVHKIAAEQVPTRVREAVGPR
ncbi:MAG: proline--tRNA ligase, partial [Planctomycetes bacterium]|nr:proline--tRNA ligase [Planctomycetota bacterium]